LPSAAGAPKSHQAAQNPPVAEQSSCCAMAHGLLLGGRIDQHRCKGCRVSRPPGRVILGCREERRIHVHGDAQEYRCAAGYRHRLPQDDDEQRVQSNRRFFQPFYMALRRGHRPPALSAGVQAARSPTMMRSRRGPECLGVRASWPPVVSVRRDGRPPCPPLQATAL